MPANLVWMDPVHDFTSKRQIDISSLDADQLFAGKLCDVLDHLLQVFPQKFLNVGAYFTVAANSVQQHLGGKIAAAGENLQSVCL